MNTNHINITNKWTAYHCSLSEIEYKEKDSRSFSENNSGYAYGYGYHTLSYHQGKYADRDVFILLNDSDVYRNRYKHPRSEIPYLNRGQRIPVPMGSINDFLLRNTTKPRFMTANNIKFDNNDWEALTLKERQIIIVEPGIRSTSTIGDLAYSQRFNSFFKNKNSDNEDIVHKKFLKLKGFDPNSLSRYGFQYSPPDLEDKEEVKHYKSLLSPRNKVNAKKIRKLLKSFAAKDAIVSNDNNSSFSLSELRCNASFPDNVTFKDGRNYNRDIKILIQAQMLPVFTKNEQPRNASVVKLAGIDAYLITPEDNKSVFKFETMSESEFNQALIDSWPNYVEQETSSVCFECSFHTLQRVLLKTNSNLVMMNDYIESLKRLTEEPKENKKLKEYAEKLKKPITKLQSLYQEHLLIQHRMMFYNCRKGAAENNSGDLKKEKHEAESILNKLKEKERGLIEKMNRQFLALFLGEFSALLIGQLHSNGHTVSCEIKSSLLAMSSEVCGLIHSYKEKADTVYSRELDALHLITPYHTSKLVNKNSVSERSAPTSELSAQVSCFPSKLSRRAIQGLRTIFIRLYSITQAFH